jgi:hypothetical protein
VKQKLTPREQRAVRAELHRHMIRQAPMNEALGDVAKAATDLVAYYRKQCPKQWNVFPVEKILTRAVDHLQQLVEIHTKAIIARSRKSSQTRKKRP